MFSELDRTDRERANGEPAAWLAGLMARYDWTAWLAADCPETDPPPDHASAADATGQDAIMRYYQTR